MYRKFALSACVLLVAIAAPPARAQAESDKSGARPEDAGAPAPSVAYESPFADYRVASDETTTSWKNANESVGRIGGWRAYAKEAQGPQSSGSPPQGAANNPTPADRVKPDHGGRGGHKTD